VLKRIADVTGGKYFRATDTDTLRRVYAEINKMEKTPFEVKKHVVFEERYHAWLLAGLLLLLLEFLLGNRRWRILQAA
jgi:Ca-activated chloride channel family protein